MNHTTPLCCRCFTPERADSLGFKSRHGYGTDPLWYHKLADSLKGKIRDFNFKDKYPKLNGVLELAKDIVDKQEQRTAGVCVPMETICYLR